MRPVRFWRHVYLLSACLCMGAACLPAHAQGFRSMRHDLPLFQNSTVAWADIDGDGLQDLAMAGVDAEGQFQSWIMHNDGDTVYTEGRTIVHETRYSFRQILASPVEYGMMVWEDVDGDGDLDLFVSGRASGGDPTARLYTNGGNGSMLPSSQPFTGLYAGEASWADYDRDGDPDLLVCGIDAEGAYRTDLYENDGGLLTQRDVGLPGVAFGTVRWGDLNGDDWPDVLVSGVESSQAALAAVYVNDRSGGFVRAPDSLEGLVFSAGDWFDFDADGDLDVVLTGGRWSPFILEGTVRVYRNDGGVLVDVAELRGAYYGSLATLDLDDDGRTDVLVTGGTHPYLATTTAPTGSRIGTAYSAPNGTFEPLRLQYVGPLTISGGYKGDLSLADYDNDGDLDIIVTGTRPSGGAFVDVLRNEVGEGGPNQPPPDPDGL